MSISKKLLILSFFVAVLGSCELLRYVPNEAPVALLTGANSAFVGLPYQLDASGSLDADLDILNFTWGFISLPQGSSLTSDDIVSSGSTASFLPDIQGDYQVSVVVSDGQATDSAELLITVVPAPNSPPVAFITGDVSGDVSVRHDLDASDSTDADGDSLSYQWVFVSLPLDSNLSSADIAAEGAIASFTPDVEGEYQVSVVVSDGEDTDTAELTINVSAIPNTSPIASLNGAISGDVDVRYDLDASDSTDADGDSLSYQWAFVSLPVGSILSSADITAEGALAFFTPDAEGDYQVSVEVSDGLDTDTASFTITIEPIPNTAPVASLTGTGSGFAENIYTLDASGSFDSDGDPLTFEWQLVSIPTDSELSDNDIDSTGSTATFVPDTTGEFTLGVIVSDGQESVPAQWTTSVQEAITRLTFEFEGFSGAPDGEYAIAGGFWYTPWDNMGLVMEMTDGSGTFQDDSMTGIKDESFNFTLVASGTWQRPWFPTTMGNVDDFGNMQNFGLTVPLDNQVHHVKIDGTDLLTAAIYLDGVQVFSGGVGHTIEVSGNITFPEAPGVAGTIYLDGDVDLEIPYNGTDLSVPYSFDYSYPLTSDPVDVYLRRVFLDVDSNGVFDPYNDWYLLGKWGESLSGEDITDLEIALEAPISLPRLIFSSQYPGITLELLPEPGLSPSYITVDLAIINYPAGYEGETLDIVVTGNDGRQNLGSLPILGNTLTTSYLTVPDSSGWIWGGNSGDDHSLSIGLNYGGYDLASLIEVAGYGEEIYFDLESVAALGDKVRITIDCSLATEY